MRDTATLTLLDQQRMARAFLALTDDDTDTEAVQSSLVKALAALAAALVIALAAPVTWLGPAAPAAPGKLGDPPAATLGNSKAVLAPADDEDAAGD